jgi:hypothetical protein
VERRASSFGSLAIKPLTKSRARNTVAGGQFNDAVRRRFEKAAERQGGEALPDDLGEKTILRARKSISATDWD